MEQNAFQINVQDNVVTALNPIAPGEVSIRGTQSKKVTAFMEISKGHKMALKDIQPGEAIIKYGVVIGSAIMEIKKGTWVHLHNIRSMYDERSTHLDVITGEPSDIAYE